MGVGQQRAGEANARLQSKLVGERRKVTQDHFRERLLPERRGYEAPADLVARRQGLAALAALHQTDTAAEPRLVTVAGVRSVSAKPANSGGTMLYVHGGGFRLGDASIWAGFASRLAAAFGIEVVVPTYRLAPENPFPGALNDLLAVFRCLAESLPDRLFVGGDSAGGGLATVIGAYGRDFAARSPDGVLLYSPWLDLNVSADSYKANASTDIAFSRASALEAAEQYLQGSSPRDPLVSPLFADLSGFPSTLVFASSSEVLADDAIALARRLIDVGSSVELHLSPKLPHAWPVVNPDFPESAETIERSASFIRALL